MKSLFLITLSIIGVSIACSGYKSAGSQPLANNNTEAQPSAQTNTATAQEKTPCTLTLAGAPTINGLRLGMTTDEVLTLFPGSKNNTSVRLDLDRAPTQLGTSSFGITPGQYETKDRFAGVNQFTFKLLDGRVSNLRVSYSGPEYAHVDKFIAQLAAQSNLPSEDQWEAFTGMDNSLKILKCTEFEVQAFVGGQGGSLNYVDVKDLIADKKLKDRRAKARAQATPTTKQ